MRGVTTLLFLLVLGFSWWAGRRPLDRAAGDGERFVFRECARESGIDFVHRAPRLDPRLDHILPHVAGIGAAVSVCDADDDGWPDLYVVQGELGRPNALYRNRGDGSFEDVAARAGLADLNRAGEGASMGSVWADADNDGDQDVLVHKWGFPQLFRNEGDLVFTDVTGAAGLRRRVNSNGATWLDFDRDGLLDLYITGYFREDVDLWNLRDTRIMQASFEFASNGGRNFLYRNLGGLRFEDVTARTGVDSTRWTLAVAAPDLNGDGWADLYLANDYGPEEYFENVAGERFVLRQGVGLDESSKSGMAVAVGDFGNDGSLGVFVTNISRSGYLFQGNNLRLNRLVERGRFLNLAKGAVEDCGWAWGAQFGDLDNDGRPDLFVLNGFVSDSRERDYWYGMSKIAIATGELAEDARNWPPMEDRSLSGYERSRVLLNEGRSRFTDVAEAVGVTDELDGRAVVLVDLRRRGRLDAVVANQKGPLLVYRNEGGPERRWIQFELEGTRGNRSAIGARVTLHHGGGLQAQEVLAGSGFCSQNDLRLHFGLGLGEAERAVVRWPSGREQTIERPEPGRVHRLLEPRE